MRISSVNFNHKNAIFKSSGRSYMDYSLKNSIITEGEISNYTELLRNDLNWRDYALVLNNNFKNQSSVNIYSLACSDLSEAYSNLISIDRFCNSPQKFKKIICYDKDDVILDVAKKRRINLEEVEIRRLERFLGYKQDYFTDKKVRIPIFGETTAPMDSYAVSKSLCDRTEIVKSDILKALKNIVDEGNSVISCRNVFPYLTEDYQKEFAKNLVLVLKPNSLFVRGAFDVRTLFIEILDDMSAKDNPNRYFEKVMTHVYRRI